MARISLEKVTVDYPIYNAETMSLRNNLIALGTGGRISRGARRVTTVRGLDGIDLELKDGDRLGLVGHNGAGKSTLLRTLAGIYRPTSGHLSVEGRISTVFGMGAGLQPELSGYDNIVRMGMMLGATRAQAEASIPDVEAFTELGDFLSVPVRTYSAGMQTRLTFAVATAAHPEILLIDEVLGAGDAEFQKKARARLRDMVDRARILVLATHSPDLMAQYCSRTLTLEHGRVVERTSA